MDLMGVYEIVAVDRRTNKILFRDFVTSVNEASAMAQVPALPMDRVASGEISIFGKKIGEYEPIRPVEIKNVD